MPFSQSMYFVVKDIVENLNSQEIAKIRAATDDLNNLLNNTAEDAYSTFPIDQIMPALVNIFQTQTHRLNAF